MLWAAAAAFLFYFLKSGRHAKWEDKHSGDKITSNSNSAVELAASPSRAEGDPTSGELEPVVTDAAILECGKVDEF